MHECTAPLKSTGPTFLARSRLKDPFWLRIPRFPCGARSPRLYRLEPDRAAWAAAHLTGAAMVAQPWEALLSELICRQRAYFERLQRTKALLADVLRRDAAAGRE